MAEVISLPDYLAQERGRAAALARALQVKPTQIGKWARGERPVPVRQAFRIEQITGGLVPRQVLVQNWWEIWPDLPKLQKAC